MSSLAYLKSYRHQLGFKVIWLLAVEKQKRLKGEVSIVKHLKRILLVNKDIVIRLLKRNLPIVKRLYNWKKL